jgi:Biotin-(acetyl-CoA carboxylase) ligase
VLGRGRKISGTLIELSTEADMVRFVVIGIGLNVNMGPGDMDREIRETATSLFLEQKKRMKDRGCVVFFCPILKDIMIFSRQRVPGPSAISGKKGPGSVESTSR